MFFLLSQATPSWATPYRSLYPGIRALGMGNAFVGLADDHQAIFYNPAGLAGIKEYDVRLLPVRIGTSSDTILSAQEGSEAFKSLSGDSLNVVMGQNIGFQGSVGPTIVGPYFGLGLIGDAQGGIYAKNQALPDITIGYQTTTGVQLGIGIPLTHTRKSDEGLRAGFALKMLMRRGGYKDIPVSDVLSLSQAKFKEMLGGYESGYGVDLGLQYVKRFQKNMKVGLGLAYTDIGNTSFGGKADPIYSNLTFGSSVSYALTEFLDFSANWDIQHLTDTRGDMRKKVHYGGEMHLAFMRFWIGINQVSLSYGAGVNLWLAEISAVTYGEELGTFAHQDTERRWLVETVFRLGL